MSIEIQITKFFSDGSCRFWKSKKFWTNIQDLDTLAISCQECEYNESDNAGVHCYCRHQECNTYTYIDVELDDGFEPRSDAYIAWGYCEDHPCCSDTCCSIRGA